MLTGIADLDLDILKSLTLRELRVVCQTSPWINQLCYQLQSELNRAKHHAKEDVDMLEHCQPDLFQCQRLTYQLHNLPYSYYDNLFNALHLDVTYPMNTQQIYQYNPMLGEDSNVRAMMLAMQNYNPPIHHLNTHILNMKVTKKLHDIAVVMKTSHNYLIHFKISLSQLKELLFHSYYDQVIND